MKEIHLGDWVGGFSSGLPNPLPSDQQQLHWISIWVREASEPDYSNAPFQDLRDFLGLRVVSQRYWK